MMEREKRLNKVVLEVSINEELDRKMNELRNAARGKADSSLRPRDARNGDDAKAREQRQRRREEFIQHQRKGGTSVSGPVKKKTKAIPRQTFGGGTQRLDGPRDGGTPLAMDMKKGGTDPLER